MTFDARKGEFCIPMLEGEPVKDCVVFELLEHGRVRAEVHVRDREGNLIPVFNKDNSDCHAMTTYIEGRGYAIPTSGPWEWKRLLTEVQYQRLK